MRLHLAFILVSLHMFCLHGLSPEQVDYSLSCLTDYLYTINCLLSVRSKEAHTFNHTHWLTFHQIQDVYNCSLAWNYSNYSCSFDTLIQNPQDDYISTFTDMDVFQITLYINRDGDISSRLLDDNFKPVEHIKPKTPCNLTVHRSYDKYHFTWKSTYEDYPYFYLTDDLKFELSYQSMNHQVEVVTLSSTIMNITVNDYNFEAETVYRVRVRSSPNQISYKGQWSEWGSEVNWKTPSKHVPPWNTVKSLLDANIIIPLCVLGPMLLFLCYIPVVKMRRNTFIPTPEPFFKSLYSECKGDFKSWVVTPSSEEDFKTEETLKIDTLTDTILDKITLCPSQGRDPSCDSPITSVSEAALLGGPPAVNPRPPPPSSSNLVRSASLISDMACVLEIDSGCWRCSAVSLEREVHLYTNEYCILSDTLGTARKAGEVVGAEDQRSELHFNETSDGVYQFD
ncbi:interleukin-21 receptor isoform X2 [Hypomesus transpacificus]|uniref:interleukin-21 receptor isoform X2 n=1 Tax=Hypomesus transpacificus TaxID=137520 RepID=UPI001F07317A|nr:interleukin-21 receptor isoform X2 [Hypomesus transpacificus]